MGITLPEAAVLSVVSIAASAVAIATGFDPLPVYTGVLAWGARGSVGR
jgi:hypothetical protein